MNGRPRAVVTGSSSGIGAAVARRLLADGRRVQGLDRAEASITHPGFAAHPVELSDRARCDEVIATLCAEGAPEALVHAAGVLRQGALGTLDAGDGLLMRQLHVQVATRLANATLRAMRGQGGGRALFIASRVWRGMPGRSQYAASKAALVSLARSWAAEVVADGVTVNVISPAATDTPMLTDSQRAATAPRLPPLGRLIQPEEVAALAAFLVSPDAAAITGQNIAVCGGASLAR